MTLLNQKEQDYINLRILIGDNQQTSSTGIDITYNLVDWLWARNICNREPDLKEVEPSGKILDFTRKVEFKYHKIKLRVYVEAVLVNSRGAVVKGEKGPISQTFG